MVNAWWTDSWIWPMYSRNLFSDMLSTSTYGLVNVQVLTLSDYAIVGSIKYFTLAKLNERYPMIYSKWDHPWYGIWANKRERLSIKQWVRQQLRCSVNSKRHLVDCQGT